MTNKSKVIKLKHQHKRIKFWNKWGGWILCGNALISISLLALVAITNIGVAFAFFESLYFGASILAVGAHDLFDKNKTRNKLSEVDQEILHLIKTDDAEMQILREYDKIEHIQKDVKEKQSELKQQKELVKELIKKKNLEAKNQQSHMPSARAFRFRDVMGAMIYGAKLRSLLC